MKTILIIEENHVLAGMYEKAFKKEGYVVQLLTEVEGLLQAVDDVSMTPSYVLVDHLIPGLDLKELLRHIKGNVRLRDAPVLMNNMAQPDHVSDIVATINKLP